MEGILHADVVVIGAGFSGIQAANDVYRAGLSCYVVEAQNRIGGKSFTKPLSTGKGHVEMGCTWISGPTQPRMLALVKKYGLETKEQWLEGNEVRKDTNGELHFSKHGQAPEV